MDFKELYLIMAFVQRQTQLQDLYIICDDKWNWNIVSSSKGLITSWDSYSAQTFEEFLEEYKKSIDK